MHKYLNTVIVMFNLLFSHRLNMCYGYYCVPHHNLPKNQTKIRKPTVQFEPDEHIVTVSALCYNDLDFLYC